MLEFVLDQCVKEFLGKIEQILEPDDEDEDLEDKAEEKLEVRCFLLLLNINCKQPKLHEAFFMLLDLKQIHAEKKTVRQISGVLKHHDFFFPPEN